MVTHKEDTKARSALPPAAGSSAASGTSQAPPPQLTGQAPPRRLRHPPPPAELRPGAAAAAEDQDVPMTDCGWAVVPHEQPQGSAVEVYTTDAGTGMDAGTGKKRKWKATASMVPFEGHTGSLVVRVAPAAVWQEHTVYFKQGESDYDQIKWALREQMGCNVQFLMLQDAEFGTKVDRENLAETDVLLNLTPNARWDPRD